MGGAGGWLEERSVSGGLRGGAGFAGVRAGVQGTQTVQCWQDETWLAST